MCVQSPAATAPALAAGYRLLADSKRRRVLVRAAVSPGVSVRVIDHSKCKCSKRTKASATAGLCLTAHRTTTAKFNCDSCDPGSTAPLPKGTRMWGCRACDYDVCTACHDFKSGSSKRADGMLRFAPTPPTPTPTPTPTPRMQRPAAETTPQDTPATLAQGAAKAAKPTRRRQHRSEPACSRAAGAGATGLEVARTQVYRPAPPPPEPTAAAKPPAKPPRRSKPRALPRTAPRTAPSSPTARRRPVPKQRRGST